MKKFVFILVENKLPKKKKVLFCNATLCTLLVGFPLHELFKILNLFSNYYYFEYLFKKILYENSVKGKES